MLASKMLFPLTVTAVAMAFSATASAANNHKSDSVEFNWSASTGLGYDSNAYMAPRSPYIDYAALPLGTNPLVTPQKKSGFFVPYEVKVDAARSLDLDTRLLGSVKADGSFYPAAELSNAREYKINLRGGSEFVLAREGKAENTVYVGALLGKHKQVYVDHDYGTAKTTTLKQADISNRYNSTGRGLEAEYKHKTGDLDYGLKGKYLISTYDDPIVVSKMDNTLFALEADTSFHVAPKSKLELSAGHSVRDFSLRHSHDAQGAYRKASPLLVYTLNTVGAVLHNRISSELALNLDFMHTQRADGNVGYNDFSENRYGARVKYERGELSGQLSLHHWARDFPNGFAFDVAGQGAKTFGGNDLKLRVKLDQDKNTAFWTELEYTSQNTTDLRYDYTRTLLMAGVSWSY